jgi:tetratricopeptide (TPR) repeat protein
MNANTNPLKVFYCYANNAEKDVELTSQLTMHLTSLRRRRKLTIWFDKMILPGTDYTLEVENHLKEADIILLLISPDFVASDYCYNLQIAALNSHEAGKVDIIPILLRPVLWEDSQSLKRLPHILPSTKIPVTLWPNCDEAFENIAIGIRDFIQAKLLSSRSWPSKEVEILNQLGDSIHEIHCPECGTPNRFGAKYCKNDGTDLISRNMIVIPKSMPPIRTKEQWVEKGNDLYKQGQYIDAFEAYEQALRLDPHYANAHYGKGNALYALGRYAEALAAYEQTLRLNPKDTDAHLKKSRVLCALERYPQALAALGDALQLNHGKTP